MNKKMSVALSAIMLCGAAVYAYAAHGNSNEASAEGGRLAEVAAQTVVKKNHGKVLVAYFSVPETDGVDASSGASRVNAGGKMMGSTAYVASVISAATGGDLFEIKTVKKYPGSHQALIDAAKKEADSNERPRLASHVKDMKKYDVVFVGFPNWWYDMPMAIYSFLGEYDMKGKTIVPFCTHGGSRFSGAVKTMREMKKGSTVLDGYAIARDNVPGSKEGVLKWLKRIGMENGK